MSRDEDDDYEEDNDYDADEDEYQPQYEQPLDTGANAMLLHEQ